jgi:DNA-binding SARP family transcriptional activator
VLRLEVLGPVRAWRDDTEIDLGSPQQRAILAILVLQQGTPVSPDQLISAIWGSAPPRAAVGMVRSYVSRLRRVLPDVIQSVGGGYAITTKTDLAEFQRLLGARERDHKTLRAALDLWHGTPLSGVNGDYAEAERIRLIQLRFTAREDLAAAELEAGLHVEADLAELIAEEPLRERPRELLMLALYRSGRQAEALDVFSQVRRLLDEELGLEPGPDLREMQRRILASDPTLNVRPTRRPTQLPPDLPEFVGRVAQLKALTSTLRRANSVIGLEGLAGVGKTALAVHAGHAVASDFPDGQLFVDLAVATEPLDELLRGLGLTDLPQSFSERLALWRTSTSGRRLLLVLDGARDGEQVRSLLPGAGGSAVVLTARRRLFGLSHAHWITLTGLPENESEALLANLIGVERVRAEPDAVRALVRRTAGLPQVLAALGTRVAVRPGWTIAEAGQRLGAPEPGSPVRPPECVAIEGPYESVLAELSTPQARAFRLLSMADGPDISLAAAAAVLDLPLAATASLLESLVDVHLLEPGGLDRYFYHEPLRVFARGRAHLDEGPEATQQALTRLVRFYSVEEDRLPSGA